MKSTSGERNKNENQEKRKKRKGLLPLVWRGLQILNAIDSIVLEGDIAPDA